MGDVEELVHGREPLPGAQLHVGEARPLACLAHVRLPAHPEHTDQADVTPDQRVDGLRGRWGDQLDVARPDRPARGGYPRGKCGAPVPQAAG